MGKDEEIMAMAAEQSLNCVHFVRKLNKQIKFESQPLGYLSAFEEI
jgi:hypothetical protein